MRSFVGKLTSRNEMDLVPLPVETLLPFRPLYAPIYVHLAQNKKFVILKGPLDFFLPKELMRLHKETSIVFLSPLHRKTSFFREAAKQCLGLLSWQKESIVGSLEPSVYETSDALLKFTASLWGMTENGTLSIDPMFCAAFMTELLGPLNGDWLLQARERDVDRYEYAILHAHLVVFFAFHLGFFDLNFLENLRDQIFLQNVALTDFNKNFKVVKEIEEIVDWTNILYPNTDIFTVDSSHFEYSLNRGSQKLRSRLDRIQMRLTHLLGAEATYTEEWTCPTP